MKLAVSSYSFSQLIKAEKTTQLDTVKLAAELGFDGIEFTDLTPHQAPSLDEQLEYADRIRAEAEKYGIEIVGYLVGAALYQGNAEADTAEVKRVKAQVDVAAALGARLFRHDVCKTEKVGGKTVSFEKMLPTVAKNARDITEYAVTKGIRTCSENHGFVAQDSDRVERLYNAVDHENYGLLVDIGNFACADENSVTAVSRIAPYAIHVHAKDFHIIPFGAPIDPDKKYITTRACNRLLGCAVGDGDIPTEQCLEILRHAGYDGYVTVEFEGPNDCVKEIQKGVERLKKWCHPINR